MRLISRKEVLNKTSLSRSTLFRRERSGDFPKAVQISANRVAYEADAVDRWILQALGIEDAAGRVSE